MHRLICLIKIGVEIMYRFSIISLSLVGLLLSSSSLMAMKGGKGNREESQDDAKPSTAVAARLGVGSPVSRGPAMPSRGFGAKLIAAQAAAQQEESQPEFCIKSAQIKALLEASRAKESYEAEVAAAKREKRAVNGEKKTGRVEIAPGVCVSLKIAPQLRLDLESALSTKYVNAYLEYSQKGMSRDQDALSALSAIHKASLSDRSIDPRLYISPLEPIIGNYQGTTLKEMVEVHGSAKGQLVKYGVFIVPAPDQKPVLLEYVFPGAFKLLEIYTPSLAVSVTKSTK